MAARRGGEIKTLSFLAMVISSSSRRGIGWPPGHGRGSDALVGTCIPPRQVVDKSAALDEPATSCYVGCPDVVHGRDRPHAQCSLEAKVETAISRSSSALPR